MDLSLLSSKYNIGMETLRDIVKDISTTPHDPREDYDPPAFSHEIMDIKDLLIGTALSGIVRNITDFGAFVDIGLHNDGLVHKSQMADHYVNHPLDVVSLGQEVSVSVVDIDYERQKISLSMRSEKHLDHKKNTTNGVKELKKIQNKSPISGNITFVSKKKY